MGRSYRDELDELASTFAETREPPAEVQLALQALHDRSLHRQVVYVGSGGTLAMAELASLCSGWRGGAMSKATTPLELAAGARDGITQSEIVLFSARARHPDVRLAARAGRAQPGNRVTLVTQVSSSDLNDGLRDSIDQVIQVPRTSADGFLATNSLLAMAATWVSSCGFELPRMLPSIVQPAPTWLAGSRRALVVYGPNHRPVAYDLEARLSETGLTEVQLADYRNLAHGRHVGLLARADETTVVYLEDSEIELLANRTQAALPPSLNSIHLRTPLAGPAGSLDLMVSSMRLVGAIAESAKTNPGAPRVSMAGRRLYHLPWASLASRPDGTRPHRLKAAEAGVRQTSGKDLLEWSAAQSRWLKTIDRTPVSAIVMDHDGTCVSTERRTLPPSNDIQHELLGLADAGVQLGFASGRGPSLIKELRRWIPKSMWPGVHVGLYNGGVVTTLDSDVGRSLALDAVMSEAVARLERDLIGSGWFTTARTQQLTVERMGTRGENIAAIVRSILGRSPDLGLKVFASGHSVDVVPMGASKCSVLTAMDPAQRETLVVGDQGQHLGNDFELLSSTTMSLSVDHVSPDPTRCWNLSGDGTSGPRLLLRYLRAMQVTDNVVRVRAERLGTSR